MTCLSEDTLEYGCWEPVRENEHLSLLLTDDEGMKVEFALDQREYLSMVEQYT
jgi:hypothetical protein